MLSVICGPSGHAADNLILKGTLLEPPPCEFNMGETSQVNFGDRVGVRKVDGKNYKQRVNYKFVCDADLKPFLVTLLLTGETTSYDNAAIQSDRDNLGIRMLIDGQPFTANMQVVMVHGRLPVIEAVPVKKPGSTLTAGAFSAAATIRVNYL